MDVVTLQASSLSSRSHATTTDHSSTAPRLSFRHRRRTKALPNNLSSPSHASPLHTTPPAASASAASSAPDPPPHKRRQSPSLLHSVANWRRNRARSSAMHDSVSAAASATAATAGGTPPMPPVARAHVVRPPPTATVASDLSMSVSVCASPATSPASSAVKAAVSDRTHLPRRMLSNTASAIKKRPIRRLTSPPRTTCHEADCASITDFLRPLLVPVGYTPDSIDPTFKPHTHLLRKLTIDDFDLNRYLFAYKPFARVNAVLGTSLLVVSELEQKGCRMSAALRSAVMYLAGNASHSVYVMTYAAQLKSIAKSHPATEHLLPQIVLEGRTLSDVEVAALDFAQQVASKDAAVSESTRHKLLSAPDADGKLERLVAAATAYAAFLSCLTATIDIELTHGSIQYAALNLHGLPWKSSGSPLNVDFNQDDVADFATANGPSDLASKHRPKRERLSLTRTYDRHNRDRSGGKPRPRGLRRVSHFIASTLMGPKSVTDVNRITEQWMKAAEIPPSGQLFDINDEIFALFGFHPFYFSTAAMESEPCRRAFLFGVKELLFKETHVSLRQKFLVCYVLTSGKERLRIVDSEHSRSFEKQGVHNGHSIASVYGTRMYDAMSIVSAHAAFLAVKYGAKPAELVAAVDVARVRSAMERFAMGESDGKGTGSGVGGSGGAGNNFPLSRRDCAAVLVAHALVRETPRLEQDDLSAFEQAFSAAAGRSRSDDEHTAQRAFMEIIATGSMWSAVERFATGTLAFDIDCSSNMVFGSGRAEPVISEFSRGADGKKIGLSLCSNEAREPLRPRSDSRASRTSSLRPSSQSAKRVYRKRTSSALNSSTRVGSLFGVSNVTSVSDESQPKRVTAVG